MTEEEWLASTDPTPMLTFLRGKTSDRKLRLFAVACCRRVWPGLRDERSRTAVETAERFADGNATADEMLAACNAAYEAVDDCLDFSPHSEDQAAAAYLVASAEVDEEPESQYDEFPYGVALHASHYAIDGMLNECWGQQATLVRDIFGNPFRPVAVDPGWLTSTVVALAGQMYESRDFAPMPVLADALQDAGCGQPDILAHCRGAGPHVRGCWVVDLLLGKN